MDARLPLSVLLLARDETRDLEALIPALGFAAEVVVVWDPRGERATREAAERLGARVFERAFDGFGPQRRFALAQCREPWVLWIDADERPAPDLASQLRTVLAEGAPPDAPGAFRLGRRTSFMGREIRHCGWERERVLRLFRRDAWNFDAAPVHERLVPEPSAHANRTADLESTLAHHSYATWEACVTKMLRYADAGAVKAWDEGRRAGPLDVALRPPLRFLRQYVLQLGFLDGGHGLVLCAFAAAQVFLKYARLWERGRGEGAPR